MAIEKILFATSEAHPLIKTGGLADVSGSLPAALNALDKDVRIILPAYRTVLDSCRDWKPIAHFELPNVNEPVRLLEGQLPGTTVLTWLVDIPSLFDREGGPYHDANGLDWSDNAQRFTAFCRAIEAIACAQIVPDWQPDIVHCNDWQTGLAAALLSQHGERPGTVFTIHNLAYQGLYPASTFAELQLTENFWSMHALEFHDQLSMIKGGLVFADMLSTVSPTYAREIQTPDFGCGLEALLRHRQDRLLGILNGADYEAWNPLKDPYIEHPYDANKLAGKAQNKAALQTAFALAKKPRTAVIGMISRLAEQKGFDLLLEALPGIMKKNVQLVILGSGDKKIEQGLRDASASYPGKIGLQIGYDEALSHRIEAGADIFLMPSRYEPCGLNQIYSLRYGTIPVVHRTGGLADTVVDLTPISQANHTANGFVFDEANASDLRAAVFRALECYRQKNVWRELVAQAMAVDFSWNSSARRYLDLYRIAYELSH